MESTALWWHRFSAAFATTRRLDYDAVAEACAPIEQEKSRHDDVFR
jgi:hypothetical protein